MGLLQDVKFAFRVLARKPGFALVVVLTLALGIGAGSAMFSILHSLLVNPLDLPDIDRLASIQISERGDMFDNGVSVRGFLDYREEAKSFSKVAAYDYWDVALTGNGGDPEEVTGFRVTEGFFDILGVRPLLGRWLAADEMTEGTSQVAVLSYSLWQNRFGGDAAVLGKTVTLGGRDHTIVGVMPAGFGIPSAAQLWAPRVFTAKEKSDRQSKYLGALARLAPGASLATADAEMHQIGARDAAAYPEDRNTELRVVSINRGMSDDYTRNFVLTLFAAAIFVLLIACANVANLFLAHALSRRKELAVRAALGAGRGRVVRQLLTEAMLLGLVGGLASLLFASWAIDAVHGALPRATVRFVPGWDNMSVNLVVLSFAVGVGILVGVVFGIVPALQVSRPDVGSVLKDEGRGTTGAAQSHRLRALLVMGQIALALVLLLGAGAMTKGFIRHADPGTTVDTENTLTFRSSLPTSRYPKQTDVVAFHNRVLARLQALPGVDAAAAVNNPYWGQHGWEQAAYPEGRVIPPEEKIVLEYRPTTAGYPELLRVPRIEGRGIEARDDEGAPKVGVVSAVAARRLWPGADPIGKRFRWGRDETSPWITVVGIVGDVNDRLDEGPRGTIFVPFAQQESTRNMTFVVRTQADPLSMARPAEAAVFAEDAAQPVFEVRTMHQVLHDRMAGLRIGAGLMGAFAMLALILAAIGIYGVVATLVTQRTHEIGIRMALGAQRRDVLSLILRKGVVLTVVGLVIGFGLGVALVRFMASILPGIVDNDARVFAVFTTAVAVIAFLGSLVPALRATRVDPLDALRDGG